ncbi:MAG TPA: hypothetical protein VFZ59_08060 [Verrucomicrobiae bacterium]|nr:hypothetical protein [Verrucomicrobiae bacterium]
MKPHGDTETLEKFLRPLARGLSPELARAFAHSCSALVFAGLLRTVSWSILRP